MKILIFGAGAAHIPLIKASYNKKNFNIVLHNKKNNLAKKISDIFFKTSIYDKREAVKVFKYLKKNKIKVDDIICRSTGPSILAAAEACKIFKINRVSKDLAKCVYSKFFFTKKLKKNNIPYLQTKKVKEITNKIYKDKWVLKPDAPLIGKKHIYLIENSKIQKDKFQIVKKVSHNSEVCITKYMPGYDVNIIFFIEKKSKKINLLNILNEWNFFKNEEINHKNSNSVIGTSSPEIFIRLKEKKLLLKHSYKILKMFPKYYGFLNIAFRINQNNATPYEININIDTIYAKKIFPYFYKKYSSYDLEIQNLMSKKIRFIKIKENGFFGYFKKKNFYNKKTFINKLRNLNIKN